MFEYTMFLMKIVREAIIETTAAILIEENQRCENQKHDDKERVLQVTLHEYRDDYKI